MEEKISFDDFDKLYMQPKDNWDFSVFKILCVKCGSTKVEYAGKTEVESGYYGEVSFENKIIIKCHDCGNAHAIKHSDSGQGYYCNCD